MGKMVEALKSEYEIDSVNTIKEAIRAAKAESEVPYAPYMSTADYLNAVNTGREPK